ncbi:helix-turn-helix domain-containing protein [uncultured Dysosmobacter sp.]|uniref:helix-turn-helix domain-containing protein n=1 Tax=uncultured Dysosmobacter sp. TaxID=2591384 RepID=UPI002608A047|nr:helix-turn-helix domain-containing protein [uncultured Dysosmobacter sp.]
MAYKYLDLTARRTIEALYLADNDATQIAEVLGVHRSTIYRELQRGATGETDHNLRPGYSAELAERRLRASFKRRGKKLDG